MKKIDSYENFDAGIEYIVDASGNVLLLGLKWFALIGSNPLKEAKNLAHSLRATHFLILGESSRTMGCINLSRHQRRTIKQAVNAKNPLYSFAHMFAHSHAQGTWAVVLPMPHDDFWLLASHNGHVLCQTDRGFASHSDLNDALDRLRVRYPKMDIKWLNEDWVDNLPQWVGDSCYPSALLKAVGGTQSVFRSTPVLLVSLALILLIVKSIFYSNHSVWKELLFSRFSEPEVNSSINSHDLEHQLSIGPFIDQPESLSKLVESIEAMPVLPKGWRLNAIRCVSEQELWRCEAGYSRTNTYARSNSLLAAKPDFSQIEIENVNTARLHWIQTRSILSMAEMTNIQSLKSVGSTVDWMENLQAITAAFSHVDLSVPISAESGRRSRQLLVRGPLRSWFLLNRIDMPINWKTFDLVWEPVSNSDITQSNLVITVEGTLFETNH